MLQKDHIEIAKNLFFGKKYDECIATCREGLKDLEYEKVLTVVLALSLMKLLRVDEALDVLNGYIVNNKDDLTIDIVRAKYEAHFSQRDIEKASETIEMMVREFDDNEDALRIAINHMSLYGDAAQVVDYCERLIAINPHTPIPHYTLSMYLQKEDISENVLSRIDFVTKGKENLSLAYFAKANLALTAGHSDIAEQSYISANNLEASLRGQAEVSLEIMWKHWKYSGVNRNTYVNKERINPQESSQIIISGLSRTGKSITEKLVRSDPQTRGLDEQCLVDTYIQHRFKGTLGDIASHILRVSKADLSDEIDKYLNFAGIDGSRRLVSTKPETIFWLPVYALWFPDAPLVFCKRDVEDNGVSMFMRAYTSSSKEFFTTKGIGEMIAAHERLVNLYADILPNPKMFLEYEDFVFNPLDVAQKLSEFLDLDADQIKTSPLLAPTGAWVHPVNSTHSDTALHASGVGIAQHLPNVAREIRKFYDEWHERNP